jgi:hypothetical protein
MKRKTISKAHVHAHAHAAPFTFIAAIIICLSFPTTNYVDAFTVIGGSNKKSFFAVDKNKFTASVSTSIVSTTTTSTNSNTISLFAKKTDEYEEEEYEYVEEDEDGEWEYEYVEEEEEYEEEEEEEDVVKTKKKKEIDESFNVPIEDDPDDPLYMEQKRIIEETIADREVFNKAKSLISTSTDAPAFLKKNFDEFLTEKMKEEGIDMSEVEDQLANIELSEDDADAAIQDFVEKRSGMSLSDRTGDFIKNLGSDEDAFPPDDDPIYQAGEGGETLGIQNKDLVRLQNALEDLVGTIQGYTDGSMVDNKQAMIRPYHELEQLDHETLDEINMVLNASAVNANGQEYGEAIKNEDPLRWLLYDLDFNVTNLMLASCKHNPSSPLILNHWMPQLCAYSRYADVRENDFQFTWDQCNSADVDELKRYYKGLGYDNIPDFEAKDTNIVDVETEYDQEDMTMSAFENWMDEVYTDENEDMYFDDEEFQPEHNVFDFDFGLKDSDTVRGFKAEYDDFKSEHSNETQTWREQFAKTTNFELVEDKEGAEAFRGHLVVACCGSDHDLELAEKITFRMKEEFGKQVYVETRVYNHARQEDNVYEIWLESYDIELIHSRRGAFYNSNSWGGPADVDDEQLDYVVKKVGELISDDARYSYHIHEFFSEV